MGVGVGVGVGVGLKWCHVPCVVLMNFLTAGFEYTRPFSTAKYLSLGKKRKDLSETPLELKIVVGIAHVLTASCRAHYDLAHQVALRSPARLGRAGSH